MLYYQKKYVDCNAFFWNNFLFFLDPFWAYHLSYQDRQDQDDQKHYNKNHSIVLCLWKKNKNRKVRCSQNHLSVVFYFSTNVLFVLFQVQFAWSIRLSHFLKRKDDHCVLAASFPVHICNDWVNAFFCNRYLLKKKWSFN